MAHHKSAIKRVRTSQQQNKRNVSYKSALKTATKKVLSTLEKDTAQAELRKTTSMLDKLVIKGIIHKNKAANQKSRLTKHVNNLA